MPFQVTFVHTDRIAFSPVLEYVWCESASGLHFIVRGVATHSKSLRINNHRTASVSNTIGSNLCGGIRVEDIITITRKPCYAVRFAPGSEWTSLVLIEPRSQGNLIVLKDKYSRDAQYGCQIDSFMKCRGLRCSVTDPSEGKRLFLAFLHSQSNAGKDRC